MRPRYKAKGQTMFEQDPEPEKKIDLERLSVEDLQERIDELKAEIAACETELQKKQSHKSAADALSLCIIFSRLPSP